MHIKMENEGFQGNIQPEREVNENLEHDLPFHQDCLSIDPKLGEFGADFRTRLLTLLSFPKFRDFGSVLGLSVLEAINNNTSIKAVDTRELQGGVKALTPALLPSLLTPFDLKRLESYGNNQLDYHVILDLLPLVATLFFQRRLNRPKSSEASGEVNNLKWKEKLEEAIGLRKVVQESNKVFNIETLSSDTPLVPSMGLGADRGERGAAAGGLGPSYENAFTGKVNCSVPLNTPDGIGLGSEGKNDNIWGKRGRHGRSRQGQREHW
ncbi:hypothetical protein F5877DRAFT_70351 [Lentinula edodes]|nr:hypothetical protein F5877DRAFT_70351 [Lentinula edodes]